MLLLLITSALSTWITYLFSLQHRLSGYTAPFILSVWILLVGCHWIFPSLLLSTTPLGAEPSSDFLRAFCLNIGQVMFQGNSISGLLFLIAIAVNSRINAFYTALGSILPIVVAVLSGMDHAILNAGLIGYNGVLCAIALGDKTIRSGVWCVCSILISILLQWLGMHWGITTLTAPFVFSVWITIILKRSLEKTVWYILKRKKDTKVNGILPSINHSHTKLFQL